MYVTLFLQFNTIELFVYSIYTDTNILIMMLSAFDKGMLDGSEISPLTRVVVFIKLRFYKGKTVLSLKTDVS